MRLCFDRPPVRFRSNDEFQRAFYDTWKMCKLFVAWLQYNGIWLADDRKEVELEYNDLYHAYDISIFDQTNVREPAESRLKAVKLLRSLDLLDPVMGEMQTWRWEPGHGPNGPDRQTMIPGTRLWIHDDVERARRRRQADKRCGMVAR